MLPTFGPDDDLPPATLAERIDDALIRLDEYRSRPGATALAVLAIVVLLTGGWWIGRPRSAGPVEDLIPSVALTPTTLGSGLGDPLIVHVVGEVDSPGVFTLPAGSRVLDAVEAAGGPTSEADLQRVNLAAGLSDGVQVRLPKIGETQTEMPAGISGQGVGEGSGSGVININLASAAQLEALAGVGPATAKAIVAHRDEHGPFTSADGLLDVSGIGPAKLAAMVDQVSVR